MTVERIDPTVRGDHRSLEVYRAQEGGIFFIKRIRGKRDFPQIFLGVGGIFPERGQKNQGKTLTKQIQTPILSLMTTKQKVQMMIIVNLTPPL